MAGEDEHIEKKREDRQYSEKTTITRERQKGQGLNMDKIIQSRSKEIPGMS